MRRSAMVLLGVLLLGDLARGEDQAPAPAAAPSATASWSAKQKLSYALGRNVGDGLKRENAEVDVDYVVRGITEGLAGKDSPMSPDETKNVMLEFQKQMMEKRQAAQKVEGEKNQASGQKFLDENKKKDGVKVTASGLQYKVLKAGDGKSPKDTDTVSAHYKGTFIDGTEFDSSYKRGTPTEFPVTGVIKGWTEALKMMKVGDKWQLVIPPDLAYGAQGRPGMPPNSTLVFEVELLGIK